MLNTIIIKGATIVEGNPSKIIREIPENER